MELQSETTQTVFALKLPILKTGDYDLQSMRIEQYLTHTNYALWEVILNGDAPAITSASAGAEGPIPPKTAKQRLARKNELKAKSTPLLAIPDEHLLKFHGIKDVKILWETIKASYLSGRCKSEVAGKSTISLEQYCFNNEKKLLNEAVNTAHDVSTASSKGQASSSTYADDVMFYFFATQSNRREVPRNPGNRNEDTQKGLLPVETPANALVVQDGIGGYNWSFQAKEGPTYFALMAHLSSCSSSSSSLDSESVTLLL
ncbi:hypothetical protein Tco_0417392 [Tanacetum coccineum]